MTPSDATERVITIHPDSPLVTSHPGEARCPSETTKLMKGREWMRILLVDDQPNIIASLVASIPWHELGFTAVHTTTSPAEARAILEKHAIDILITDIEMPHEDGLSLVGWVRESGLDVECILLTSHADFQYAKRAISLKVTDYIIQPARTEDIIHAVHSAIANRKARSDQENARHYGGFDFAAKNEIVKALFDGWPTGEASRFAPSQVHDRYAQIKKFNPLFDPENPGVFLCMHIRKWRKLPLSPSAFIPKYQDILNQLLPETTQSCISYSADDNTFHTVFFNALTEPFINALREMHQRLTGSLGCELRVFFCASRFHHVREALDSLNQEALEYELEHPSRFSCFQQVFVQDVQSQTGYDIYEKYLDTIKKYILANMSEPITRTQIADALHLSPSHVSHIIKTVEGLSCKELVTKIKMDHARNLLRHSKLPIGDIAVLCGYDSFAYFSKVYRQTFALTPSGERGHAES